MKIILREFPTHIAKTNNKSSPNKMIKINNQSIYNGYINRFTRNIVMSNLHSYLYHTLNKFNYSKLDFPIDMTVNIYTVRNHGSISMRKGKVCWNPPNKTYVPNWDIENLAVVWIKAISDSLVKAKILPDDNIKYIKSIKYEFFEVKDIKERKLEIILE